jgi:hypothetical protein
MQLQQRTLIAENDGWEGARHPTARVPEWLSVELIEKTRAVWQPYYASPLTDEDAKAIVLNVGRLFDVLSDVGDKDSLKGN